jgi:hypothetical protein
MEKVIFHHHALTSIFLFCRSLIFSFALQVHFQHAELVHKRDKLTQLQHTHTSAEQRRQTALDKLDETIRHQNTKYQHNFHAKRIASSILGKDTGRVASQNEALQSELDNDRDGRLMEKWPHLIRTKGQFLLEHAEQDSRDCESLQRVVDGYRDKLQLVIPQENEDNDKENSDEHSYECGATMKMNDVFDTNKPGNTSDVSLCHAMIVEPPALGDSINAATFDNSSAMQPTATTNGVVRDLE